MAKFDTPMLLRFAKAFERLAGASTVTEASEAGYWLRIAKASETLAGASTTANASIAGYQLRATVALEALPPGGIVVTPPPPAPAFTTQPSISPGSGTAGTTVFTASDGVASNTNTALTRRWLLGATAIGTGTTVTPPSAGQLTLEVTATGAGGTTIATSAAVTVAAATGTLDPSITALQVTADPTSPADGSAPKFIIESDDTADVALGYKIVGEWYSKAGALLGTGESATLTAAPDGTPLTISGLASLPAGTRRYRFRLQRTNGAAYSAWSLTVIVGPDDIEPTLSLPTEGTIGATTATLGFTSNEAGTAYHVAVPSAEADPTNIQVKAGQKANGTAAPATDSGPAIAGVNSFDFTGLTVETPYKACTVVEDAAGNLSAVLTDAFTTAAAGASVAKLATAAPGKDPLLTVSGDGLSVTQTVDNGAMQFVRSDNPMPDLSHFEISVTSLTGTPLIFVGVQDAAADNGIAGDKFHGFDKPGVMAWILSADTSGGFQVNGDYPGHGSQALVGDVYSFDTNIGANTIVFKRHRSGVTTTLGTYTLTSLIPTNWRAFIGFKGGAGHTLTANFGASAFLITPLTGHTGF